MTKITVDKALIEQAIAGAVFDFAGYITSHPDTIEVGSTADASPIVQRIRAWAKHSGLSIDSANVESWNAVLADPVVEPVRYLWEQLTFTGECMAWVEVCTTYDPRLDEYRELHQDIKDWGDNRCVRGFMPLYTSPTPPAEVPMLTDDEIRTIFLAHAKNNAHGFPYLTAYLENGAHLMRQVERAVRQNAGLK